MSENSIFVFWHPVLTEHQSYTLDEFGAVANATVIVFVADLEHGDRIRQGWTRVDGSSLKIELRLIPTKGWLRYVWRQLYLHRSASHVFGSPFERPRTMVALFVACLLRLRVFLISEPYSPIAAGYFGTRIRTVDFIKARLRPIAYRIYGLVLARKISGVFAISPLAVFQYRKFGMRTDRLFPFGYFVPRQSLVCASAGMRSGVPERALRLVCVASLIPRKGIAELISCAKALRARGVAIWVDFYGPGDPAKFDFDESSARYRGVIPFGKAQETIGTYDLLVLPSLYDGWGVVVNEAILAGVPVVCSDRVGAGAVIRKWKCGSVYRYDEEVALENILWKIFKRPELLGPMRQSARTASAVLEPSVAGKYMLDVFQFGARLAGRPICPWYDVSQET